MEEKKVRFKKVGGGTLRLPGRIIKPGQVFMAFPREIPDSFRDVVIPMDALPEEKEEEYPVTASEYEVKARGYGGYYDVIQKATGKQMNEKALRQAAALDLVRELEG